MDDKSLYELKQKIKRADELNYTISKIDELVKDLESFGKCEDFTFGNWVRARAGWGVTDESETVWGKVNITPEILGIGKGEFHDWYSRIILEKLWALKFLKMEELKKL